MTHRCLFSLDFKNPAVKGHVCLQLALIVPTIDINCKLSFSYFYQTVDEPADVMWLLVLIMVIYHHDWISQFILLKLFL